MDNYRQLSLFPFMEEDSGKSDDRAPASVTWNLWHGCTRASSGCAHCYMFRRDMEHGKDPTKVDRSAAYAARYVAKNIVAAGLASRCEVELAYAIGVANPVSILVDTFGTGKVSDEKLSAAVNDIFDLRPAAIIDMLDLRKPQYKQLAAYGHMGREDLGVAWERTDKVQALLDAVK